MQISKWPTSCLSELLKQISELMSHAQAKFNEFQSNSVLTMKTLAPGLVWHLKSISRNYAIM